MHEDMLRLWEKLCKSSDCSSVATEVLFHGSRLHEYQELGVKKSRRGQINGFWKP